VTELLRFFFAKSLSDLGTQILNDFSSPDSSGKPGAKKTNFSCQKRATKGSYFLAKKNRFFSEDL
jgi:hypothetical protein